MLTVANTQNSIPAEILDRYNRCYATAGQPINANLLAVANGFMLNLASLGISEAEKPQIRLINIVARNKVSNRGAVKQRGVAASEKAVLDICRLTPLVGYQGVGAPAVRTVLEEVAWYRMKYLQLDKSPLCSADMYLAKKKGFLLFIDYLLAHSLCYVERFTGSRVEKFFGTRNPLIAATLCQQSQAEVAKYAAYLSVSADVYAADMLTMLKISTGGKVLKLTVPRKPFLINDDIKVTPVFFMNIWSSAIVKALHEGILKFSYIKDNKQIRDMYSTMNRGILQHYYKDDALIDSFMSNIDLDKLRRGYIKIPEVGISRYDDSGCRALNLTRITDIERVTGIDDRFIDVDLSIPQNTFSQYIDRLSLDFVLLCKLYSLIFNMEINPSMSSLQVKKAILDWCHSSIVLGSTTFLRQLHILMVSNPLFFPGYTGKPESYSGGQGVSSFNLGISKTIDL